MLSRVSSLDNKPPTFYKNIGRIAQSEEHSRSIISSLRSSSFSLPSRESRYFHSLIVDILFTRRIIPGEGNREETCGRRCSCSSAPFRSRRRKERASVDRVPTTSWSGSMTSGDRTEPVVIKCVYDHIADRVLLIARTSRVHLLPVTSIHSWRFFDCK